ncbi:exosortase A [Piscinibacter koreensis]|uniref:Exosortase A n=1 Tax=Piscinibacter koreensis TaxID=2742824 RepID=A0A7Y6NL35_9BURK|nr:exosortase A [Schlegelella koreensis]NUZ05142.1 exosortase A [Schlegelella koreensis]
MTPPSWSNVSPNWRRALAALLLVVIGILAVYRETAESMVSIWARSSTFAHAFLVPPISLWLIWRQREAMLRLTPSPNPWMLVPIFVIAVAWLFGDLATTNAVTQLALVGLLVLAVPAVLGLRVAHTILFPLLFLFFAVPIGDFLLPQLMTWTADFTVVALRASGIPVYREGMLFIIPSGAWSVVEACSGVRYLIASMMVGTLFAYLQYRSYRRRVGFIAISILVPIVANWLRAYMIVMIGHLSNNKLAVGVDHLIYGWVFFGIVMGLMFAFGAWWQEPAGAAAAKPLADVAPRARRFATLGPVAAAALLVAAIPHIALAVIDDGIVATPPQLAALPDLAPRWPAVGSGEWKPSFQNTAAEATSAYRGAGGAVGVYVGYYRQQTYDRKLVTSGNALVHSDDPNWARVGPWIIERSQSAGNTVEFRSALLRRKGGLGAPDESLRVWQVYWVAEHLTPHDSWAKVYAAFDRLRGRGDDAAVIVLHSPEDRPGSGRATLDAFTRANLAAIVARLHETRHPNGAALAATRP